METKPNSTQTESPNSHQGATQHCGAHGKGRRRGAFIFTLVVALAAGLAGGYVGKSFAHGGPGHSRDGMPTDPAKMDQRVEHMINRLASKVDASAEQKDKLATIAKSAVKDLAPLREKAQAARKQAITLLAAANVDRPALERERLFEPFYRLPGATSGAGLGLSLVRQIAVRHGGSAKVRAGTAGGACITVEIAANVDDQ